MMKRMLSDVINRIPIDMLVKDREQVMEEMTVKFSQNPAFLKVMLAFVKASFKVVSLPGIRDVHPWVSDKETHGVTLPINEDLKFNNVLLPYPVISEFIERSSYRMLMNVCGCRKAYDCPNHSPEIGCLNLGESVLDMPPGIGDPTLDVIRLMKRVEFCIITTQSKVVTETVKKTLQVLLQLDIPIIGIIQNMATHDRSLKGQIDKLGVPLLGQIPFDAQLEGTTGNPQKLLQTDFSKSARGLIAEHIEKGFQEPEAIGKNKPVTGRHLSLLTTAWYFRTKISGAPGGRSTRSTIAPSGTKNF